MQNTRKRKWPGVLLLSAVVLMAACEPMVTTFDDVEDAVMYTAEGMTTAPTSVDTITVMTWNIRFGAGRAHWFGDSPGDRVILPEDEVYQNLDGIAATIDRIQPDILFMQEADVQSKRTGYIDEVQYILNNTHFNYAAFASIWKAQSIPSDGLGRMDMGNVVFSRWPITSAERIKLPLRGDQDALTKYFYLRRNILKTKIALPGLADFYAVDIHTSAFSTDDTKKRQVDMFKNELDKLAAKDIPFVAGGDFNLLPPGTSVIDYCMVDKRADESFHGANDDPYHKEGSYFGPEIDWMQEMYDAYSSAVPLAEYQSNQSHYFSHTTDWNAPYDRKLDYLWAKRPWIAGSDFTHQEAAPWSDHAPVSAKWEVPK